MTIFTICIPTYNRLNTIKRTIMSLEQQTFKDFEIIIVDDGSTDGTDSYLEKYSYDSEINIKYIKKQNGGKHTALNVGIQDAKGEFFLILDSDDMLVETALEDLYAQWVNIPNNIKNEYCGIMGRCCDINGKLIGNEFPSEGFISSYVDFHFVTGPKMGGYGDCCEIIRTNILKEYSYPESENFMFVPEAYIFDQIGTKYKILCTNKVFKIVEYLTDGITKNKIQHIQKNQFGYLEYYVCLLDKVFKETEDSINIKSKIIIWWRYWSIVIKDSEAKGARCKNVTLLGRTMCLLYPLIGLTYKIKEYFNLDHS